MMAHSHTDSHSTHADKKDDFSTEQISEVNSTSTSTPITDEQRTLWQNIKKYRKVSWVTLGLASAILLYGYDNVVVGTISGMPQFQYVWPPTPRLSQFHNTLPRNLWYKLRSEANKEQ
jgi:hypothetical protein